jgi:Peptidase family S41
MHTCKSHCALLCAAHWSQHVVLLLIVNMMNTVQELPYNSALKFTVAKYYTPSGRCIQSVDYSSGGVATAVSTVGDAPTTIVPSEQVICLSCFDTAFHIQLYMLYTVQRVR